MKSLKQAAESTLDVNNAVDNAFTTAVDSGVDSGVNNAIQWAVKWAVKWAVYKDGHMAVTRAVRDGVYSAVDDRVSSFGD